MKYKWNLNLQIYTVHLQQKESGLLLQKQGESRVTMTG